MTANELSPAIPGCQCETCTPNIWDEMRMIVCAVCGNKRCPHARDHRNACTRSNEPGQKGARWEHVQPPLKLQPPLKRIFICGPMSGLPENNYPAFNAAAAKLHAEGWRVENPAANPSCETWEGYMRLSIAQLVTCDGIYLLPGWEDSRGARLETNIALNLGLHFDANEDAITIDQDAQNAQDEEDAEDAEFELRLGGICKH